MPSIPVSISHKVDPSLPWCVYVVVYSGTALNHDGERLHPFYIGFKNMKQMLTTDYCGSVMSIQWRKIWELEQLFNPHLFKRKIIRTFETKTEANNFEKEFLIHFDAKNHSFFVNKANGYLSGRVFGCKVGPQSPEHIEKRASKLRGKPRDEETKLKISQTSTGRKLSIKTKEKMSKAQSNRTPPSKETRKKLSKIRMGKSYFKHTKESKEKIGKGNSGKIRTEESKNLMRQRKLHQSMEWNFLQKTNFKVYQKLIQKPRAKLSRVPIEFRIQINKELENP